jgi:hypothetical protein
MERRLGSLYKLIKKVQSYVEFLSRTLALLLIVLCFSTAHGQETRVVVIPLFGDDAASKWRGPWVTDTAYKKVRSSNLVAVAI